MERTFFGRYSGQLSQAIISDAIKQVAADADINRVEKLLAVLAHRQANLEFVLRRQTAETRQPTPSEASTCPLCDGLGSLDSLRSLIRFRVPIEHTASRSGQLILDLNVAGASAAASPEIVDTRTELTAEQRVRVAELLKHVGAQLIGPSSVPPAKTDESEQRMAAELSQLLGDHRRRQSIEQLVNELRAERAKLDEKLCEFKRLEAKSQRSAIISASRPPIQQPPAPPSRSEEHQEPASGGRSLVSAAGGHLSSSIQRMKRMDTLKRRRMKREQQQQCEQVSFQRGRHLPPIQQSFDLGDAAQNLESIRFARVRSSSSGENRDAKTNSDNDELGDLSSRDDECSSRADSFGSLAEHTSSAPLGSQKAPIIPEEPIIEEQSVRPPPPRPQPPTSSVREGLGGFFRRKFSRSGDQNNATSRDRPEKDSSGPMAPSLGHDSTESCDLASGQATHNHQAQTRSSTSPRLGCLNSTRKGTSADSGGGTARSSVDKDSGSSSVGYAYHNLRASLANLINEAAGVRPKLSLANAFASLSASSSPVKKSKGSPTKGKKLPPSPTKTRV